MPCLRLSLLGFVLLETLLPGIARANAQSAMRVLKKRDVPCQVEYAQAVGTIGLARWSAPEAERPSLERLLNAAAKAKELIDGNFLEWSSQLCSMETISRLRASVDRIEANKWLPASPEDKREAQEAAVNAELMKATDPSGR